MVKIEKNTQTHKTNKKNTKIFVLDTSVILYDHNSINCFQDNDVVIPITVLEELDNFKQGNDVKNYEAREFIRTMDKLSNKSTLIEWIKLEHNNAGNFKVLLHEYDMNNITNIFIENIPDHRILNATLHLKKENPDRKVILVTKDINLRLKAKSLNILSEDFETGKIKNIDNIYSGKKIFENIEKSVIDKLYETGYCLPSDIKWDNPISNQYLIIKNGKSSVLSYYNPLTKNIEKIDKYSAYRISPRNAEQVFALHAIMNQDIKVVTLQGVAGTGKTLLALAGAIEQKKEFKQIYVSRPMIPLSNKDYVGFLPGPIMEKINPYMEPLWDNLKFIQHQFKETDKEFKFISDAVQSEKIVVCPLSFIRGRSISNVLFIIDECLTKNHLVWTSDGKALPIQNIIDGDELISYNIHTKEKNKNNTSNTFERTTKDIVKIKTHKGVFECTETHNWWVYENGIELKKKISKDLSTNDLMLIADKIPHVVKNNLSIEYSKLLALIITSGYIENNTIKIKKSKDIDWLSQQFELITKEFKISINCNEKRNIIKCNIMNSKMTQNFILNHKLICDKNSNTIEIPDIIWNSPIDSLKSFITMCFDTNGDINYNSKKNSLIIKFSTISKVFAYQLSTLLLKFDIESNIYHSKSKKSKDGNKYNIIINDYFAKKFLQDIGFSINRKQKIYETIKDNIYSKTVYYPLKVVYDIRKQLVNSTKKIEIDTLINKLNKKNITIIDNNIYEYLLEIIKHENLNIDTYFPCSKIDSIDYRKLTESISVYDFTVENDHTFVVNGVISSNCQNLTPHEVKTIITRAGEGTKFILTGDINQIDTSYLDKESNGLSHLIDKTKNHPLCAHIKLEKGERSTLADMANELL